MISPKRKFLSREYSYYEQVECGFHRLETRLVWTIDMSELPPLHNQALWTGLKTVVMIVNEGCGRKPPLKPVFI
jgi:hypothetical protein